MKLPILSLALCLIFSNLSATGPSFIKVEMNPVSVNGRGEVLCRTRYEANPMGVRTFMDVEYGYCIVTAGGIVEAEEPFVLKYGMYTDPDIYLEHRAYWDTFFYGGPDPENMSETEQRLRTLYGFTESNPECYRRDRVVPLMEFEAASNADLSAVAQKSLKGGIGQFPADRDGGETVHLPNR